jgi:hypothetical protein
MIREGVELSSTPTFSGLPIPKKSPTILDFIFTQGIVWSGLVGIACGKTQR